MRFIASLCVACLTVLVPALAAAQTAPANRVFDNAEIAKLNAWTVGLAAGQLEGAPIRFATDIARVVDDGNNLHVLPIVTRGPTENVEALLYLKGVDVAVINTDSLEQFRGQIPDIQKRITYVLNLFPSELHIFARPGIDSLEQLSGKKVNFNTRGTTASYSGPLMFQKLGLHVEELYIPHQVAMEKMRSGSNEIDAVVWVTSKPIDAFLKGSWPPGFKFLPVPFQDFSFYLPASLTSKDYPGLIPEGQEIPTLAVPTVLAAYNWPVGSNRYARVERLTQRLFDKIETLQGPGFHPKWRDVVLNAEVPGLTRFRGAQDWLERATTIAAVQQSAQPNSGALSPIDQRLFQEFMAWRQSHRAEGRTQ